MPSIILPCGVRCYVSDSDCVLITRPCSAYVLLPIDDLLALVRYALTSTDLKPKDPRLKLIKEIRESAITRNQTTGTERIVLDLLRVVSRRKVLRSLHGRQTRGQKAGRSS